MTHLGLFEGIGGFSLAAHWMGWQTLAWCEWNEFGQRVLRHHFPHAEGFGDITKTDFNKYHGKIDIITGGFPCQPYSTAGKRKGKDDERHLWPHMLRTIREVRPRYVVGENVLGLVNWSGGLVFEEVQADLEAEGYEVLPFILPAAGVGAPHRRDRVWFIARAHTHPDSGRLEGSAQTTKHVANAQGQPGERLRPQQPEDRQPQQGQPGGGSLEDNCRNVTDTDRAGREGRSLQGDQENTAQTGSGPGNRAQRAGLDGPSTDTSGGRLQPQGRPAQLEGRRSFLNNSQDDQPAWKNFPTQPPVCGGNDGLPRQLDGITFPKWRNESIRAYGNAIVPQVAFAIFTAIKETEDKIHL